MEIELVEPDFFIRNIPNKKVRKDILKRLVTAIKEKI